MSTLSASAPALGAHRWTLLDGRVVVVRPLRTADRAELAAAISRLSQRSRYLRFAAPRPQLSDRELDALMDVDHQAREAYVAFTHDERTGVAVGRFAAVPARPGVAEVAVTVDDRWHGQGLGRRMLGLVLGRAHAEGHVVALATVLGENLAARRLVEEAGFRPVRRSGPVSEYELRLAEVQVAVGSGASDESG